MTRCTYPTDGHHTCGSYAFNLMHEGIDQGDYCDRHYWQAKAEQLQAERDGTSQRPWDAGYRGSNKAATPQGANMTSDKSEPLPTCPPLDLRDQFAMHAITAAQVFEAGYCLPDGQIITPLGIAGWAYQIADAMLHVRK